MALWRWRFVCLEIRADVKKKRNFRSKAERRAITLENGVLKEDPAKDGGSPLRKAAAG